MPEQEQPGPGPLDGPLDELEPEESLELEGPPGDFVGAGFAAGGFGQQPPAPPQPEIPATRGKGNTKEPYRVAVIAINAAITHATFLRCRAFWAAPAHQERAKLLSVEQALSEYLDTVTFQHAAEDELRPEGERLYDWEELHMQGLRPKIQAEMDAIRAQVAAETAQGTRDTILARLAVLELPEALKAKVLTAIQEVSNLEL